jgi:hypothetical protein
MLRVSEPNVAVEQTKPGRGQESHFRRKLAGLFGPIIELARNLLVEKNDQLARRDAIFCPAEAEDIDTCLPGNFLRRTPQRRHRIGETCAVHVNGHVSAARKLRDRRDFVRPVNGAQLGRLRDADGARLVRVQFVLFGHDRFGLADVDLAIASAHYEQSGAFREKFRCAAFIDPNVRMFMTDNAVKRLAELCQGERVGRGAVKN